jgi:hypothetical protein
MSGESDELLTVDVVKRRLWDWANELAQQPDRRRLLQRSVTLIDEYQRLLSGRPDEAEK